VQGVNGLAMLTMESSALSYPALVDQFKIEILGRPARVGLRVIHYQARD